MFKLQVFLGFCFQSLISFINKSNIIVSYLSVSSIWLGVSHMVFFNFMNWKKRLPLMYFVLVTNFLKQPFFKLVNGK